MKATIPCARIFRQGFTLIELLIVVAIIAILAAIAVPNFLEAQVRAKIGRTKADMRTIALAMEAYAIDHGNKYPILNGYLGTPYEPSNIERGGIFLATGLSTPVAYLTTTSMPDTFNKKKDHDIYGEIDNTGKPGDNGAESFTYHYVNTIVCRVRYWKLKPDSRPAYWIFSFGPDYVKGPDVTNGLLLADLNRAAFWLADYSRMTEKVDPSLRFEMFNYDASNGTISAGDIIRHQ